MSEEYIFYKPAKHYFRYAWLILLVLIMLGIVFSNYHVPIEQDAGLEGHQDAVWSVAFSPDGKTALSASNDKTLILWDIATGKPIRQFEGHKAGLSAVEFSPDGKTALSAAYDKTLILWDLKTGAIIRRFKGHSEPALSVAFSSDGKTALSSSYDKTMILWDIETGAIIRRFKGHSEKIYNLAFSPDSTQALSASQDGTVILWDIASGKPIQQLVAHRGYVTDVADVQFLPDGHAALSVELVSGRVILWNLTDGTVSKEYQLNTYRPTSFSIRTDGKRFLTTSCRSWDLVYDMTCLGGRLNLIDIKNGKIIRQYDGHQGLALSVAISPDGRYIISGGQDATVILWNLETGDILWQSKRVGTE